MKNRIQKGGYGYIGYARRVAVIRTVLMFAVCAAVFLIGFLTTGTRRNLLTIVAVLGALPASKSMVNLIMFIRARGCSSDLHDRVEACLGALRGDAQFPFSDAYDLYLTSYQSNYPISHIISGKGMVTGVCEVPDIDTAACEKHIEGSLHADGIKDMTVKIYTDVDKYVSRLQSLAGLDPNTGIKSGDAVISTLKSIAL